MKTEVVDYVVDYLEEPSRGDMAAALGSKRVTFAFGWTIRRCLDCDEPVAGGPLRCMVCATTGMQVDVYDHAALTNGAGMRLRMKQHSQWCALYPWEAELVRDGLGTGESGLSPGDINRLSYFEMDGPAAAAGLAFGCVCGSRRGEHEWAPGWVEAHRGCRVPIRDVIAAAWDKVAARQADGALRARPGGPDLNPTTVASWVEPVPVEPPIRLPYIVTPKTPRERLRRWWENVRACWRGIRRPDRSVRAEFHAHTFEGKRQTYVRIHTADPDTVIDRKPTTQDWERFGRQYLEYLAARLRRAVCPWWRS